MRKRTNWMNVTTRSKHSVEHNHTTALFQHPKRMKRISQDMLFTNMSAEHIYTSCIRPAMLYGSEIWPTKVEDIRKIQRSEMRMLRWMAGVSLSERKSNDCVRSMLAIDDIAEVMRRNRLRWFCHVERRDELCWIKRIETLQVDGDGVKGRPRKRWREVLKEDMREKGLCREDACDRSRWRRMLWEGHVRLTPVHWEKQPP